MPTTKTADEKPPEHLDSINEPGSYNLANTPPPPEPPPPPPPPAPHKREQGRR